MGVFDVSVLKFPIQFFIVVSFDETLFTLSGVKIQK